MAHLPSSFTSYLPFRIKITRKSSFSRCFSMMFSSYTRFSLSIFLNVGEGHSSREGEKKRIYCTWYTKIVCMYVCLYASCCSCSMEVLSYVQFLFYPRLVVDFTLFHLFYFFLLVKIQQQLQKTTFRT